MNDYITKYSENMLSRIYKEEVVRGYYDSESYFKKSGNEEQFKTSEPYKYWIKCSTSKLYKEELEQVIQKWKDDIMLGYGVYMEQAINMEDDDTEVRAKLIKYNNEYNGTFEYICKQFEDGYYYTEPNYEYVYDVLNN